MTQWLVDSLFDGRDRAKPRFAFNGTINWMRALSLLVTGEDFESTALNQHYKNVKRRTVNVEADKLVLQNMMMAVQYHAAVSRLSKVRTHPYDICRSAIISWYYSTYFTCSAMVAAASGSNQEQHAKTAKVWHRDIVDQGLVLFPFDLNLDTLVTKDVDAQIQIYKGQNSYDLNTYPTNKGEALGAAVSYLNGTHEYEKERMELKIRDSKEFKELNVDNFRTTKARNVRDSELRKHKVNYLVQAIRYRGKANYRDSIFLGYGLDNSDKLIVYLKDLDNVSGAFQRMAAIYLNKRIEAGLYDQFVNDLKVNSRLSLDPSYLTS